MRIVGYFEAGSIVLYKFTGKQVLEDWSELFRDSK